jgi:pimeloyl-ACP methyl ester carboxylesterase
VRILVGSLAGVAATALLLHVAAIRDMDAERRARRYLGDRLFADVRGSGDPVVFLAGLQGSTNYWGRTFDALAGSRRLIFVDELGFGRSPWPEQSRYALDDQLGALRRTLMALGATRRVTLVAHSFGAVLAAHYAARYPDEIARVVLLGTPVFDSRQEGLHRIREMSSLGSLFTFNHPLAIAACTTMCALRPLLRRVLPRLDRSRPAAVVSDSVLHDLGSVDGSIRILLTRPIRPFIMLLGSRVTMFHGSADAVTPLPVIRHLSAVSGARLVTVDADHHHYLAHASNEIIAEITRP